MTNKLNFKQVFIAGLTAAAVSSIINVILFFIFKSTGLITDDIFVQPVYSGEVDPLIPGQADPSVRGLLVVV